MTKETGNPGEIRGEILGNAIAEIVLLGISSTNVDEMEHNQWRVCRQGQVILDCGFCIVEHGFGKKEGCKTKMLPLTTSNSPISNPTRRAVLTLRNFWMPKVCQNPLDCSGSRA